MILVLIMPCEALTTHSTALWIMYIRDKTLSGQEREKLTPAEAGTIRKTAKVNHRHALFNLDAPTKSGLVVISHAHIVCYNHLYHIWKTTCHQSH